MIVKCPDCGREIEVEEPKRSRKGWWIALIIVLLLGVGAGGAGYFFYEQTQGQSEQYAYENAIQSNEPAVLQNFLDIYVTAPQAHRETVTDRLEKLKKIEAEWMNVIRSKSKTALLKYMKLYPQNVHNIEARLIIDSLDWELAANVNTIASYKNYLDNHSDGLYLDVAKHLYESLIDEAKKQAAQQKADSMNAAMQQQEPQAIELPSSGL